MVDIDALMEKATKSEEPEDAYELWRVLFTQEKWHFIPVGEGEDMTIWIPVIADHATFFAFSDMERAQKFAVENELFKEDDKQMILSIPVKEFMENIDTYIEQEVDHFAMNGAWDMSMDSLKQTHEFLVVPFDLAALHERSQSETSMDTIKELYSSVFSLPSWYFIGNTNQDKTGVLMTEHEDTYAVHVFLSQYLAHVFLKEYSESPLEMKDITDSTGDGKFDAASPTKPDMQMQVFKLDPGDGLNFLTQLDRGGKLIVTLHSDNAELEAPVGKLIEIKQELGL